MGMSFHDEASMVEVMGSFLHFTPDSSDPDSIPEMGSISQERKDESDDCIAGSDDIQIMVAERWTYIERLRTQAARSEAIVISVDIVDREQHPPHSYLDCYHHRRVPLFL